MKSIAYLMTARVDQPDTWHELPCGDLGNLYGRAAVLFMANRVWFDQMKAVGE